MNKKMIGLAAAAVLIFGGSGFYFMTADNNNAENSDADQTDTSGTMIDNTQETDFTNKDNKTLVVYYSATGSTKRVADHIAAYFHADIFEIQPKNEYTSDDLDWTDDDSRVSREYADETLRAAELSQSQPENWESYDTVFIGYPIWWGIAAWPTDSFVTANDFEGKTVIPFCTSASSGLGDSGNLLKEKAKNGNWLEGYRFSSSASQDDVKDWLNNIANDIQGGNHE